MRKGSHHSQDSKIRIRLGGLGNKNRRGKPCSEETKIKLRLVRSRQIPPNLGIKMSNKQKQKIRDSLIGKKHTTETKLKMSKSHLGHVGITMTPEHLEILRLSNIGNKYRLGKYHSKKTREKIRIAREKQVIPMKDSKPERMMQLALSLKKIQFEKHKAVLGQPDIFIKPNICLFVDGCFWHGCELCNQKARDKTYRDVIINHNLMLDGYIVIRIWEHDIIKSGSRVQKNIISMIQKLMISAV